MAYQIDRRTFILYETVEMLYKYVNGISFCDIAESMARLYGDAFPAAFTQRLQCLERISREVCAGLDVQNAKIKETDDKITITIPHCTIDEDSIKIKSSDLKIYDTNFAIMSVDKEAVMELVGEAEKKAKKKAESDEYGFLENADENAKKVIKGMFENVAGERKVVVEFK